MTIDWKPVFIQRIKTKESTQNNFSQIRVRNGIRTVGFSFQLSSILDFFFLFFLTELTKLLASTSLPRTFLNFPLPFISPLIVFDLHPSWPFFLLVSFFFLLLRDPENSYSSFLWSSSSLFSLWEAEGSCSIFPWSSLSYFLLSPAQETSSFVTSVPPLLVWSKAFPAISFMMVSISSWRGSDLLRLDLPAMSFMREWISWILLFNPRSFVTSSLLIPSN